MHFTSPNNESQFFSIALVSYQSHTDALKTNLIFNSFLGVNECATRVLGLVTCYQVTAEHTQWISLGFPSHMVFILVVNNVIFYAIL